MDNLQERFAKLPATCVADGLGGGNSLDWGIKPLREEYILCGRALTVDMPAGDNGAVLRAIARAEPGQVLVIDAKGYGQRAVAGDFVIGLAKLTGLAGVVVDGCIRDLAGIKAMNFPVFCKGSTPSAGGKAGNGSVNVPVSCGGVSVNPGDFIIGDADGVVAVPQNREEAILLAAEQKFHKDEARAAAYLKNEETARQYLRDLFR